MTIESDSYYHCLCNRIHVHQGAYYIAIIGIVLQSLGLIGHLVENKIELAIGALISLICYVCVLYANKNEKPQFYLPHIILNAISLIFGAIVYIIAIIAAIAIVLSDKKEDKINGKQAATVAVWVIVFSVIVFITYLIQIYFIRVVYRARHYMINVMHQSQVPHFTQTGIPSVTNIL